MSISHYFVRPTNGADVAGVGTTHMTAYKTTQFALNDIGGTHGRNTVDGDQINICDSSLEGADVLAAPLTLVTYGTPTSAAPLILRGYIAITNDGGVGEINCNGTIMWASGYSNIILADLEIHNAGNNNLVQLGTNIHVFRCELHQTGVNAGTRILLSLNAGLVTGCYLHHTGNWGNNICISIAHGLVQGCFVDLGTTTKDGIILTSPGYMTVLGNIVRSNLAASSGIISYGVSTSLVIGNVVYNLAAGTASGIRMGDAAGEYGWNIRNNIVCGWSGAGGAGVRVTDNLYVVGYNAYYNNTTNLLVGDQIFIDETAHDVQLLADPFINAAGGDFSLTAAAQAALRSAGWPSSYLGANTDPHITIGAVQYGEGGGGGAIRRAMRILGG